jgi:hypothetical protein
MRRYYSRKCGMAQRNIREMGAGLAEMVFILLYDFQKSFTEILV